MLVQPTTQQLIALVGVRQHSRWVEVDKLLTDEIAKAVELMVDQTDTTRLHELRGRIKGLRDFQSVAREASQSLEKLGVKTPL